MIFHGSQSYRKYNDNNNFSNPPAIITWYKDNEPFKDLAAFIYPFEGEDFQYHSGKQCRNYISYFLYNVQQFKLFSSFHEKFISKFQESKYFE